MFDETRGNKRFAFILGVGEVIKGWDKGVVGMRVGDKRKLIVPPSMAYGSTGDASMPSFHDFSYHGPLKCLARCSGLLDAFLRNEPHDVGGSCSQSHSAATNSATCSACIRTAPAVRLAASRMHASWTSCCCKVSMRARSVVAFTEHQPCPFRCFGCDSQERHAHV